MFSSRIPAFLVAATAALLATSGARGAIGIEPIADQNVPSGKTLVVPIVATDPSGPARSYTFKIGAPKNDGKSTTAAGIMATVRTGDPHWILGIRYTGSNGVLQTGTMEFQMLREFAPTTTANIGGLAQGGFYSPATTTGTTRYMTFHRVVPGFVIQGGDPTATGAGGPGFAFQDEFSNALIYSGTVGQLGMANSNQSTNQTDGLANASNGNTNGSQFFITLSSDRTDLDYGYTIFGQMLRGFSTLTGIAGTPVEDNGDGEESKPVNPVDITSANLVTNNTDAVLILSATGVCDAPVTITATSGTASVTRSFTVHALADTFSDPPFAAPVPSITAANGTANVPVSATDLQLDLIRYGYQQFLPSNSLSISYHSMPALSLPLVSNTDNFFGAEVDSWAGSQRGYEGRPFHIAAGANPLTGSIPAIPIGTFGQLKLSAFAIALFSSHNPTDTAASFTATVNYGDGTVLSGTNLSIVNTGGLGFKIVASHTYAHPGEYPILVNIADPAGTRLSLTHTAIVAPSAIGISAPDITHTGGALANAVVATFKDVGPANGKYLASINWGDGGISNGLITGTDPNFQVLGSHTYGDSRAYTISTTVSRTGTSAGYAASAWSTAHISGVTPAPQVLPPFPSGPSRAGMDDVTTGTIPGSGNTVQYFVSASVALVNSGNRPSAPGSFSVYVDPDGTMDTNATVLGVQGTAAFPVPALNPGEAYNFSFVLQNGVDARLTLPPGFNPTGQTVIGVVTYSDPVGNFDGSQKIVPFANF